MNARTLHPGTVVTVPGLGPVTVVTVSRRYFVGVTADGTIVAETGIGIATLERLGSTP
jgi:hypothetical protein